MQEIQTTIVPNRRVRCAHCGALSDTNAYQNDGGQGAGDSIECRCCGRGIAVDDGQTAGEAA